MQIKLIQKIIDAIRLKNAFSPFMLGGEWDIIKKIKHIEAYKEYETLILGSSHIETSYIADEKEFNLATSSQDLYYSYNLYKKYNTNNLKNVIVSISNFSFWHHLIRGKSSTFTLYFKLLSNIDYEETIYAIKKKLYLYELLYRHKINKVYKNIDLDKSYRGNYEDYPMGYATLKDDAKESIQKAEHRERDCANKYLLPLIKDTTDKKQNLFFVITPQMKELRDLLPEKQIVFKELFDLASNYPNVEIIDLYDSEDFIKEDFYDYQHLNYSGAMKLTKIVRGKVYGECNA